MNDISEDGLLGPKHVALGSQNNKWLFIVKCRVNLTEYYTVIQYIQSNVVHVYYMLQSTQCGPKGPGLRQ